MRFKKIDPDAILPYRKHIGDAGWDVCSVDDVYLLPNTQKVYDTGLELVDVEQPVLEIPFRSYTHFQKMGSLNCALFVWPKSGLDTSVGLHTGAGVIDHIYRGLVKILLKNEGANLIVLPAGTPIAQLVPLVYLEQGCEWSEDSGTQTTRGAHGGIVDA